MIGIGIDLLQGNPVRLERFGITLGTDIHFSRRPQFVIVQKGDNGGEISWHGIFELDHVSVGEGHRPTVRHPSFRRERAR